MLRRLLAAMVLIALVWAGLSGALASVAATAGTALSDFVTGSLGGASAAPPDDRLGCDDFDPTTAKAVRKDRLTAQPTLLGCDWFVTDAQGRRNVALHLQEFVGASESENPTLELTRESGVPKVSVTSAGGAETTILWVAAGVPVSRAESAPVATRSMTVQVSHELLGLSAKQGRQVAVAVATSVSRHHEPVPDPTPASRG